MLSHKHSRRWNARSPRKTGYDDSEQPVRQPWHIIISSMNDDITLVSKPVDEAVADSTAADPAPDKPAVKTPTVGVFDSGVGGFTVAGAIHRLRPDLNLVYFGDSLNMPYGGRPLIQIAEFARRSIEFLLERGMDILAVGCNTSNSALGQGELKSFGVPTFDLVSSTIEWLRDQPGVKSIGLVATHAAIISGYWERKLTEALPEINVIPVAAPEFVPLVEAYDHNEFACRAAVKRHIEPLLEQGVTHLLHGCTHYPLLQPYMEELSPELAYIDPAQCLAGKLSASLSPAGADAPAGVLRLFSSLPGESFYQTGQRVFGRPVRELTRMYIVNPYED